MINKFTFTETVFLTARKTEKKLTTTFCYKSLSKGDDIKKSEGNSSILSCKLLGHFPITFSIIMKVENDVLSVSLLLEQNGEP